MSYKSFSDNIYDVFERTIHAMSIAKEPLQQIPIKAGRSTVDLLPKGLQVKIDSLFAANSLRRTVEKS